MDWTGIWIGLGVVILLGIAAGILSVEIQSGGDADRELMSGG